MTHESVTLHLIAAAIFAVGFGGAGFLFQGRSTSAIIAVVWSAAGVFMPLALLIALYARIAHLDRSIPFAILAIMLAVFLATVVITVVMAVQIPKGFFPIQDTGLISGVSEAG